MLEQVPVFIALPTSLWTSLSHNILHFDLSPQPSSCPSFPLFPTPLTVCPPGTFRLGPTPQRLVTRAVYSPTSLSWGFHVSMSHSRRFLHPAITSSRGNKISSVPFKVQSRWYLSCEAFPELLCSTPFLRNRAASSVFPLLQLPTCCISVFISIVRAPWVRTVLLNLYLKFLAQKSSINTCRVFSLSLLN